MLNDIRFAFRQLVKSPGFTGVALATLALGIGANTAMFTVLNAIVLKKSPAPEPARLISVFRTAPQSQTWPFSPANFKDLRDQNTSFSSMAAYTWASVNLAEPGQPAERLAAVTASAEFFTQFGVSPVVGRLFTPKEDQAGTGRVALISDGLWRSHFGGDSSVIGKVLRIDGAPVTVVGVMPAIYEEPMYFGRVDVWEPLNYDAKTWEIRNNNWLQAVGRLKPGVSMARAQAEMAAIAARLEHDHPETNAQNSVNLVPWDSVRQDPTTTKIIWLCMGLSGFVLLIACANLANLQLARTADRLHEHALRMALGASRLQLMRQFIVESLLLSLLGATVGIFVALWATRYLGSQITITEVPGFDLPVNRPVLLFNLAAAVATGVIFGTAPAMIASRADVNSALKQSGRGSTAGRSRHRMRHALIVCELALALVLLGGAGHFVNGIQRLVKSDMGWRPEGLVTASLTIPFNANYATDEQCRAFFDKLEARMAGLPGVEGASISATLPIAGFWSSGNFAVEGRPLAQEGKEPLTYYNPVTSGYFSAVGIRLVRGRAFNDADRQGRTQVVIINESMARTMWPGQDPIGKRIGDPDPANPDWRVVVGVVADIRALVEVFRPADTPFQAYRPLAQVPGNTAHYLSLAVRSSAPPSAVGAALRSAVSGIDSDQPVFSLHTATESIQHFTGGLALAGRILSAFALLGLTLSAVGLYGVIANVVAQRTPEIGIRMALGAQAREVVWMVLKQGMVLALVGAAIGLACAAGIIRMLNSILPAVSGGGPATLAAMTAVLIAVALIACYLPARRATRINPISALRSD